MHQAVKFSRVLLASFVSFQAFATNTPTMRANIDNCPALTGIYSGTYRDTTGLFPATAFPIRLYLAYQNKMLYGYTFPANDSTGAQYGLSPYALIWANCQNSQITNLYIIKNSNNMCGSPAVLPVFVAVNGFLNLNFNYENAMINANFKVNLEAISPRILGGLLSPTRFNQAVAASKAGISTCH